MCNLNLVEGAKTRRNDSNNAGGGGGGGGRKEIIHKTHFWYKIHILKHTENRERCGEVVCLLGITFYSKCC